MANARFLITLALLCVLPPSTLWAQSTITTSGATQISVGLNNTGPDGSSSEIVSPPNRDMVVFVSSASNLVIGDDNNLPDIFQFTPERGIRRLNINPITGQAPATGQGSFGPAVSPILPDGSYAVAFISDATDLVSNYQSPLQNNPKQIYLRLPKTNETLLVSVGKPTAAIQGQLGANADCDQVSVTALANPNRYVVVFRSKAGNLTTPGNPYNHDTVFRATFTTSNSKTTLSSLGGARDQDDTDLTNPVISGNGRFVAFVADGTLAGEPNNTKKQVYVFDQTSKNITLVSKNAAGNLGGADSSLPSISFLGEKIAFISTATNLVPQSTGDPIAIQFDSTSGTLSQINLSAAGQQSDGDAYSVRLSPSGKLVTFADSGTNLVADTQTNGKIQTYVKDLQSGSIIRTSVTSAGVAGDGDSGASIPSPSTPPLSLAFGSLGFNSRVLFNPFGSTAQNLTSVGISSQDKPNVFRSEVTPPKPTLVNNVTIEAPPDVKIDRVLPNNRGAQVTIVLQEFSDGTSTARIDPTSSAIESRATSIKYTLEIRKVGSRQRTFRTLSRNSTTISKLSPGKYSIRYRVTKTSGRRKIKSKYSTKQSLTVS